MLTLGPISVTGPRGAVAGGSGSPRKLKPGLVNESSLKPSAVL